MRIAVFLLSVLCLCISGCAPTQLSRSDIPVWDEGILQDSAGTEPSSLSDRLLDTFVGNSNYHFRKVRWGFSRERVEFSETGNTVIERRGNAIAYNCKVNGVYCKLIYTFKDNKLRAAGYVTINPIPTADNLTKEAVSTHGMPDIHETYLDGLEELVWKTPDTVIFANLSPTVTKVTPSKYDYSNRGLLKGVLKEQSQPGRIVYKDGVYTHVDPAFFNELHEMNFPALELSFYEKQLMGVLLKGRRLKIHGIGTIPQ